MAEKAIVTIDDLIRKGGWMDTISGGRVNIFRPTWKMISIYDIAHALSMICRFGGHIKKFYSVAQHSILVSQICPEEYALQGLLHDATEAYCGDMIRPIKVLMPNYREMEDGLHRAISKAFDMKYGKKIQKIIKKYDNIMLVTERRDLKHGNGPQWAHIEPLKEKIRPWGPNKARREFIERYLELTGDTSGRRTD